MGFDVQTFHNIIDADFTHCSKQSIDLGKYFALNGVSVPHGIPLLSLTNVSTVGNPCPSA
jgi:hypothetical protein